MNGLFKLSIAFFIVSLLLLQGCTPPDNGAGQKNIVHVTQAISTPTTWTSDNIYMIDQSIVVEAALTIQAGTIVKFTTAKYLGATITGTITAVGSSSSHIVFTSSADDTQGGDSDNSAASPQKGDWQSVNANTDGNSFAYCDFYYGGFGEDEFDAMLTIQIDGSASIDHCTFAHSLHAAVDLQAAKPSTTITNSVMYDTTKPLWLTPDFSIDDSNMFHNPQNSSQTNAFNGIWLLSSQSIIADRSWGETEVPFVSDGFYINDGITLTIATGGVVLKFSAGRITVYTGASISNFDNGIYTSIKDDNHLGDTNNDGNTSPASGDWEGVWYFDDPPNHWRTGTTNILFSAY